MNRKDVLLRHLHKAFGEASVGLVLTVCLQPSLFAQSKGTKASQPRVNVPFVGCKSDGQTGQLDAPKKNFKTVVISQQVSSRLAYYEAAQEEMGVLAPRGWYCFGVYGSGGNSLFVSPSPINTGKIFNGISFGGPAIVLSHHYGGTSGRLAVADMIARVFPAYRARIKNLLEEPYQKDLPVGPYPGDRLEYKSENKVEYRTPAQTQGLGTSSNLVKNNSPIDGVAILVGNYPDALLLSVRLPSAMTNLGREIIRQVEHDAEDFPPN